MKLNRYREASEAGYTLAEMLIVVSIVGLVAAVTIPSVGTFFKAYKVRSAADQITGHLRAARQISVSQRVPVDFTINESPTNTYSFSYTIPGEATTTETFEIPGQITLTNAPSGALTFTLEKNGTVDNPTTPDDQSPSANYLTVSAPINGSSTDTYTITILVAGKVGQRFTRG